MGAARNPHNLEKKEEEGGKQKTNKNVFKGEAEERVSTGGNGKLDLNGVYLNVVSERVY